MSEEDLRPRAEGVYLHPEDWTRLERAAKAAHISKSAWMRQAIIQRLEQEESTA